MREEELEEGVLPDVKVLQLSKAHGSTCPLVSDARPTASMSTVLKINGTYESLPPPFVIGKHLQLSDHITNSPTSELGYNGSVSSCVCISRSSQVALIPSQASSDL